MEKSDIVNASFYYWAVIGIIVVIAAVRLFIITWGMPYPANMAHEHSLFYDSRAVVHDQYRALYSLHEFPGGFAAEAVRSYMPLLQRYIAAPIVGPWLWLLFDGVIPSLHEVPFAIHSYPTILVNRLVSYAASLALIGWLGWILWRVRVPAAAALLLVGIFALNPTEIGHAINEKTITLLTVIYTIQYTWLLLWYERLQQKNPASWRYCWLAAAMIGVAAGAREQGIFFAGMLFICGVGAVLFATRQWRWLSIKRGIALLFAPVVGLALTSPDFILKWEFWLQNFVDPPRSWDFGIHLATLVDMWYLAEILLAGSIGIVLWIVGWGYLMATFKRQNPLVQTLVVWLPCFVIAQLIYPMKDPRFMQPVVVFGFVLAGTISVQIGSFFQKRRRYWTVAGILVMGLWFFQSLVWGTSALAFFSGSDNRLRAADEFQEQVPAGETVAKVFTSIHDREIPISEQRYQLYAWDHRRRAVYDQSGNVFKDPAQWPHYILIQHEMDAVWEPPDQEQVMAWREQIQGSGLYYRTKIYPKRRWYGTGVGIYGTRSRWAYLNPVVEVYAKKR